ncbi:vanadium-dependent haloperoxidase [Candidatus Nitrotoga sp. 1052]|uniref:vanadium-dependent haloperoxidase n=1 Tax=Candidatus Nitrotoga sp. 1052 TaxID=2886964 RepID=UPI001EF6D02C|nr:vanadium-dependent haloperoxidase [Candidatus Nitrotoga sp. 1052]CAH1090969.1 acidPPc domain-containing protein [Candidatus Nitrotoga sp. 1052]
MRREICAVLIAFMLLPAAVDGWANAANLSTQTAWPQWLPAEDRQAQQQLGKLASNTNLAIESTLPAQDKAAKGVASWQANWTREPASLVWNDFALKLVVKYRLNPLRASRTLALLHVANYEAVRLATREKLPKQAQALALHSAASAMLDYLFPLESPGRYQALGRAAYLAYTTDPRKLKGYDQAWGLGQQAAVSMISRALLDGASLTWDPADQPAMAPGHWRPAPPVFARFPAAPLAARWRTWLEATRALGAPPPVLYDSPAYWEETQEVLRVSKELTPEQKKIADDWNLDQGSVTPSGVWNLKAAKLIEKNHLDTTVAARVFSALNVAMADAMIAAWRVKYEFWTQRPVTAIQDKFDPKFMPYLVTPSFPGYVSAHATVSGAASVVLTGFFPEAGDELQKAAAEAALSRLYGGIHFSSDNNQGLILGRRVGEIVLQQLRQAGASNSHKAGKRPRTQGN